MVLGMKFGINERDELQKEKVYALTNLFLDEFNKRYDTLICRELLGYDMRTEKGKREIKRLNLRELKCNNFVKTAVEIIEKIIKENE